MTSGPRSLVQALSVMILSVGVFTAAALGQGRPSHIIRIGPPFPLGSLHELWTKTRVVVLATAFEVGPNQLNNQKVVRFQFFDIDEVLKDQDGVLKNSRIRVMHEGGTAMFGGEEYVTTSPDGPPPQAGRQVVLFLAHDKGQDFVVPYGPGGTYVVTDKVAETITLSQIPQKFPELSGRREITKSDFLALLRGFATGR